MKTMRCIAVVLAFTCLSLTAAEPVTGLQGIQSDWARINYADTDSNKKADDFKALIEQAQALVTAQPESAELLIWLGIIQSSTAGAEGGLGALAYAKAAKKNFETALNINENALHGSALASLGVLYHKVPGWPIGFGSDKKAEKLLKRALEVNPDGIDSNYFYAEYLFDEGEYRQALVFLDKATHAAPRADRPLADEGRRNDIAVLKAKLDKKLN
ncbi:tetratricopeptide repeat protein [Alteromonas gilva]|uniref:Tetratricopeptide repeat protein n=1 Tax=Alteromonas gilva TaxID=2987522 RepID=A0ABT5KWZ1_9ALTE|nr:tetratricopeptide repeat protein [Alteromonas gilva]MDC8829285.1 tetratricopeptide repeat protein [Alteromonas gilva]